MRCLIKKKFHWAFWTLLRAVPNRKPEKTKAFHSHSHSLHILSQCLLPQIMVLEPRELNLGRSAIPFHQVINSFKWASLAWPIQLLRSRSSSPDLGSPAHRKAPCTTFLTVDCKFNFELHERRRQHPHQQSSTAAHFYNVLSNRNVERESEFVALPRQSRRASPAVRQSSSRLG